MEIKPYKKEASYSYTLGAFPTMELVKHRKQEVRKIILHTSFTNESVLAYFQQYAANIEIIYQNKLIEKLSQKDNCYVVGVFQKYENRLCSNCDHLVLVHPMNMGNLGTMFRTALGFGIQDVALIAPCSDPFDPKVLRAAMGANFGLRIQVFDSFQQYQACFGEHVLIPFMLQTERLLQTITFPNAPISLIFGNESSGLDASFLSPLAVRIEHENAIDSLNLPTAVGIALYEYKKQRK